MTDRKTPPPSAGTPTAPRVSRSGRTHQKLSPDQYELKIRWQRARRVLRVTSGGVKFEFDTALTVGVMYPITVDAPGVSLATTLEVTRCQLTVADGRFFLIDGRFYPYVE
jgi:hypothetical protein